VSWDRYQERLEKATTAKEARAIFLEELEFPPLIAGSDWTPFGIVVHRDLWPLRDLGVTGWDAWEKKDRSLKGFLKLVDGRPYYAARLTIQGEANRQKSILAAYRRSLEEEENPHE